MQLSLSSVFGPSRLPREEPQRLHGQSSFPSPSPPSLGAVDLSAPTDLPLLGPVLRVSWCLASFTEGQFIHGVARTGAPSCCVAAWWPIVLRLYLTCSLVGGHVGCGHVLAVVNSAALHVHASLFVWTQFSFLVVE